jgi:hypothetical protein
MANVTPPAKTLAAAATNPANPATDVPAARKRIPMSVPQARLSTSPIVGYRQYWFLEKNIARAKQAGYEFVNEPNVAMDSQISGNSDLGTNVSVIGGEGSDGKPERLILMKIKEEWFEEDQKALVARNIMVLQGIFKDQKIDHGPTANAEDQGQAYVKRALLNRPLKRQV